MAELRATVTAWLGATSEPQLALPAVNSFLRMLQYRELAKPQFGDASHPGARVRALGGGGRSSSGAAAAAAARARQGQLRCAAAPPGRPCPLLIATTATAPTLPPGFYVTKAEPPAGGPPALVLVRASAAQAAEYEAAQKRARLEEIQRGAGFSRVLELLAASGRPAVGHNPLFDVAYTLGQFVDQQLPPSWQDFRGLCAK